VTDLHVRDDRGSEVVRGLSFEVRAGEILGIAGVAGNGQDELVEAITGLRHPATGSIEIMGHDVARWSVRARREHGLGYVPGDRQRYGLVLDFPVADNIVLTEYTRRPTRGVSRGSNQAIVERAEQAIAEFDIRTPSATVSAGPCRVATSRS
jgi:simple sugar transport system ATP-binding protein